MKSLVLLTLFCFLLSFVNGQLEPLVCASSRLQEKNYSLCELWPETSWCGDLSTPVSMDNLYFSCSDPRSHCVQPPPSPSANSPSCVPDPSGDPNRAKCHYLQHSVPFEIMSNSTIDKDGTNGPQQFLALISQDTFSLTNMKNEIVVYNESIAYGVLNVSVVSPSNFINIVYIVVLTTANRLIVYQVSLYTTLSVTTCSTYTNVTQIDTTHDVRTNTTWIAGIQAGNEESYAFFFQIDPVSGCPALIPKSWELESSDDSVNVSLINRVAFVTQIEPDHSFNSTAGCFPPLSSRTLVYFYSPRFVFVFGFDGSSFPSEVELSENGTATIYDATLISPTATITAATIFGECYGNLQSPSQMLWLSMAILDTASLGSSLHAISLNEFALSPLNCDSNDTDWWLHPGSFRSLCSIVDSDCDNKNFYVNAENSCTARQLGFPLPLESSPSYLVHRMQTNPYNQIGEFYNYAHLLFSWQQSGIYLRIDAFQEITCNTTTPQSPFILQKIANIGVGRLLDTVHISENGQHVLIASPKEQWELASNSRLLEICDHLNSSSSDPVTAFLTPFSTTCSSVRPANFSAYDYMHYYSPCSGGAVCWRYGNHKNLTTEDYHNTIIEIPPETKFSIRPTSEYFCDLGFYCPGQGRRVECTIGHICDVPGLATPNPCVLNPAYNTTCSVSGLIAPVPCPPGMICLVPSAQPIPAPPGFYITEMDRTDFFACTLGEWCSLQRTNVSNGMPVDLECSPGSFCNTTSVITPALCGVQEVNGQNLTQYCPNATTNPNLCPTGYYCPSTTLQIPCSSPYYCPAGTSHGALCPAGYYCPTPSERILCPSRHYCREGFIQPQKCHFLVVCPEGTESERLAISGVIFNIAIVVAMLLAFYLARKLRRKFREKRDSAVPQGQGHSKTINLKRKENTINFGFERMGLELHGSKKKVLDGVTGEIKAGRVTAVMGPSGAGKTTFLTTLAGKASYGKRTGTVYINGEPADIQNYKKVLGFVPQEDVMHRMLTVREIIRFNAEVRLPTSMTYAEKEQMTNEVLNVLGLWDIRYQIIGDETKRGISGGQRKRVNIGMELVADPTVIFLDEPTSGLDSTSSEEVVSCLRTVADKMGLTIVTVLHQPRYEIFQMFHDVLLLGKGGRTVYIGPSVDALAYFQSIGFTCPDRTNPPDFFMDVISGRVPREGYPDFNASDLFEIWESRAPKLDVRRNFTESMGIDHESATESSLLITYAPSSSSPKNAALNKETHRKTAGFFVQLVLFTHRALIQQARDWKGFFWDNLLIVIAGSLLGALYIDVPYKGPISPQLATLCPDFISKVCSLPQIDDLNAMGSLVSLSIGFTAIAASMRCFGTEKVVFWRESAAGINKAAYFLGKNIAQLVNIVLAPVVFLTIFYTLTSPRATFNEYYVVLFLLQFAVVGIGYMISILLAYKDAQLTGVVIALVWAMFGGLSPTLKTLEENFITYAASVLSPYRWSQEALYISEIQNYENIYNTRSSVEFWGYDMDNKTTDLLSLLAIGLGIRFFGMLGLMVLNRDKML